VVLSPEEVARLLDEAQSSSLGDLKCKAALSVVYGAGLRSSEGVSLKVSDSLNGSPSHLHGRCGSKRPVPSSQTKLLLVQFVYPRRLLTPSGP